MIPGKLPPTSHHYHLLLNLNANRRRSINSVSNDKRVKEPKGKIILSLQIAKLSIVPPSKKRRRKKKRGRQRRTRTQETIPTHHCKAYNSLNRIYLGITCSQCLDMKNFTSKLCSNGMGIFSISEPFSKKTRKQD